MVNRVLDIRYPLIFIIALQFSVKRAAAEIQEARFAVVTVCVANMREEPRHAAEMATQCLLGTPLEVRDQRSGWCAVTTPEGYKCWVTSGSIVTMTKTEFNQWIGVSKVIYRKHHGTVRLEPCEDSSAVSDITEGCVIERQDSKNRFVNLRFPDGRTGCIKQDDCSDFETWKQEMRPTSDSVVKKALEFMGVAYLWGGTSPKMFDCSGLIKHCFFMNGVIVPRNATQQARMGESIDIDSKLEKLERGDLVFFGSQNRVTHVGIYIENGLFVHEAGRVCLNNLLPGNERYDRSSAVRLMSVRRWIGRINDHEIVPVAEHPLYQLQPK